MKQALPPSAAREPEACRDGRDLENGRDLEVQPLVHHFTYDTNSRWHRFKKAVMEPPKSTVSIYADIPFNHAEWKRHRNAAWRHRPQPVLFMRVAGGFWWQLTYSFIVSIFVGIYHHHVGTTSGISSKLSVPFNLTTFALSLLLVFRTNSSYSRWWEARQIWGAVVNLSRNFSRQSMLWLPPRKARVAVRWMMAAPYLLKCHLRFNASVRENVSHILLPQELEWVLGWTHRPNAAAHILATAVLSGGLDTIREKLLMELVNTYIDCVGKCERIFKTPIPAAYTRHTSRYLMIYLTACPMVLWSSLGWWTPVAATLITFLLLGTENIGVQIEEPFRVLPLDDMCRGIEATIREMERQNNRLGEQFSTWLADPAGLSRESSQSSLDSFQDGPADGPSEPSALNRFHHIPPPAPLITAAQAILSLTKHGSTGGQQPSGDPSSGQSISNRSAGPSALIGGFLHHVLHPHGSASGGGGNDAEEGDAERLRSANSSHGAPMHYPHHQHHPHRNLPQHPADSPGAGAAFMSPSTSMRRDDLSLRRLGAAEPARLSAEHSPPSPYSGAAGPAAPPLHAAAGSSPFARLSQQEQQQQRGRLSPAPVQQEGAGGAEACGIAKCSSGGGAAGEGCGPREAEAEAQKAEGKAREAES